MTNNTIQDKLSLIALTGVQDFFHTNRKVYNRRVGKPTSNIIDTRKTCKGRKVTHHIQLSLFQ